MKRFICMSVILFAQQIYAGNMSSSREIALEYTGIIFRNCDGSIVNFWDKGSEVNWKNICTINEEIRNSGNVIKIGEVFLRKFPGDNNHENWVVTVDADASVFHLMIPFNKKNKIVGTFIYPGLSAREQKIPMADYKTKNDYSPPFKGLWHVDQGGEYRIYNHHLSDWQSRCGNAFAYDFEKLTDRGRRLAGNANKLANYPSFGEDVLAIADGTIEEVVDGVPDRMGVSNGLHLAGNIVVINHGNDEYSLTAHLKEGSILVKKGDRVKRGQNIAKCGNSGDAGGESSPHIHIQLQNNSILCNADSLFFGFTNVILNGQPEKLAFPKMGDSLQSE